MRDFIRIVFWYISFVFVYGIYHIGRAILSFKEWLDGVMSVMKGKFMSNGRLWLIDEQIRILSVKLGNLDREFKNAGSLQDENKITMMRLRAEKMLDALIAQRNAEIERLQAEASDNNGA